MKSKRPPAPFRLLIVMVTILLLTGMSSNVNTITYQEGSKKPVCQDWAKIKLHEYEVNNNIWGRGKIRDYSQCVFGVLNSASGLPVDFGWSWRWPKVVDGVKAYPAILYGRKPWNDYSTTTALPQAVNKLHHVTVSYNLKMRHSGAVNLLLEAWVTRTSKARPEERVGELAIQLYQRGWPGQAGKYQESVVIDNIPFDFYLDKKISAPGDSHVWAYYGFVRKGRVLSKSKLDVMRFVNYLAQKGYVNQRHYIASVELGNEIDHGRGRTIVKHFSVQVKSTASERTIK